MAWALGGLMLACGSGPEAPEAPERRTWADVAQKNGGDEAARRAANEAPTVRSVRIEPPEPMPGERVRAVVDVDEPDGNRFAIGYTWFADGWELDRGAPSVDLPENLRAGDLIEVTVVVGDGIAESEPVRATTKVGNRRPRVVGLSVEPAGNVTPGQAIVVKPEASDTDGDDLEYEYTWTVNGEPQEIDSWGPQDRFPTEGLRSGDRIEVTVVARDRRGARSRPLSSGPIALGDAAPEILSAPSGYDGGTFRYAIEARDPQGGQLHFSLRKRPEGMTVDPRRGEVVWLPKASQAGIHPVEVVVENRSGTRAIQAFDLEVSLGVAAKVGR